MTLKGVEMATEQERQPDSHQLDPKPLVVVSQAELSGQTAQTPGMKRVVAFNKDTVGAQRMWMGHVTNVANTRAGNHHHGEAETGVYVLDGTFRVYFGENYEEYVECNAGDYLYVPAWTPHYEANETSIDSHTIVFRSPDNIVVNLD